MIRSLDLDPIDRMLRSTDGTVTTLLEACAGEAIATRTTRVAGPGARDLLLAVVGRWWHPDETRLLAESLVAVDRLSAAAIERLMRTGGSLGRVLMAGSRDALPGSRDRRYARGGEFRRPAGVAGHDARTPQLPDHGRPRGGCPRERVARSATTTSITMPLPCPITVRERSAVTGPLPCRSRGGTQSGLCLLVLEAVQGVRSA